MRRRLLFTVGIVTIIALASGCDSTSPEPSLTDLVGTWDLISMTDSVTVGTTTGTMTFGAGGTFSIVGTVTYPGEPTDSLVIAGTYAQSGSAVTLTIGGTPSTWQVTFSGSEVVFTPTGGGNISFRLRRHA